MSQHIHRTITLILIERWTITWLPDDQVVAAHTDSTSISQEVPIIVQYSQTMVCEVEEDIQTVMTKLCMFPLLREFFRE